MTDTALLDPEGHVAAGQHRDPANGRIVFPPDVPPTGRVRRVFLRRMLSAEAAAESEEVGELHRAAWYRAGGGVVCDQCGEEFYDHPRDPVESSLTVMCNRERVKL
jgi:hypothetical protein